jgi:hypothetical protein
LKLIPQGRAPRCKFSPPPAFDPGPGYTDFPAVGLFLEKRLPKH